MSDPKSSSTPPPKAPAPKAPAPKAKPSMQANEKLIGRSIVGSGTPQRRH